MTSSILLYMYFLLSVPFSAHLSSAPGEKVAWHRGKFWVCLFIFLGSPAGVSGFLYCTSKPAPELRSNQQKQRFNSNSAKQTSFAGGNCCLVRAFSRLFSFTNNFVNSKCIFFNKAFLLLVLTTLNIKKQGSESLVSRAAAGRSTLLMVAFILPCWEKQEVEVVGFLH